MATNPSPSDEEIQREVALALASDPSVDLVDPGVEVQGGVVTLRGLVGGEKHRARAGVVAGSIAGVGAVDNQIELAAVSAEADPEVARQVEEALVATPELEGTTIRATVHFGVVHLAGVVASAAQRAAAESAARGVAGAQGVRDSLQLAAEMPRTDPEIEGAVRLALLDRLLMGRSEIVIEVHAGVVRLAGSVAEARLRDGAEAVARAMPGVQGVENQLRVP